jgi:hypothetical protein
MNIKVYNFFTFAFRKVIKRLCNKNEGVLIRKLNHKNIIEYFEDFIQNEDLYVVLEYFEVHSFVWHDRKCFEFIFNLI